MPSYRPVWCWVWHTRQWMFYFIIVLFSMVTAWQELWGETFGWSFEKGHEKKVIKCNITINKIHMETVVSKPGLVKVSKRLWQSCPNPSKRWGFDASKTFQVFCNENTVKSLQQQHMITPPLSWFYVEWMWVNILYYSIAAEVLLETTQQQKRYLSTRDTSAWKVMPILLPNNPPGLTISHTC